MEMPLPLMTVCAAAVAAATSQPPAGDVAAVVRQQAMAHGFDGAILIGRPDGRQIHFSTKANLDPDAVWRWASITKQLTAVLVMQEVAAKRIDLDATINRYLPDWPGPTASSIRVRDLLLHNSGLPQPDVDTPDPDGVPAFYRSNARTPSQSAYGYCAGKPRAKAPAAYEYNNCDSIVLGEILAKVTGSSFDRLVKERFGRRLGLRSLGMYRLSGNPTTHVRPTGAFADLDSLINLGVNGPAAGAYGTIGDLWRFDHALLSGKLLSRASRETMWRSTKANGFYGFHQWIYPAPLKGCARPVRIIERQGLVGGIELRNYLLPESGRALILFSRHRPTRLGDPYEGKGFAFDLLSTVACRPSGEFKGFN